MATNLHATSAEDKSFVKNMLVLARMIDNLYATQIGAAALAPQVPADDAASQSLFRRDWGPKCVAP